MPGAFVRKPEPALLPPPWGVVRCPALLLCRRLSQQGGFLGFAYLQYSLSMLCADAR